MAAISKTELIRRVAHGTGMSNREISDLVNATLDAIRDALRAGEDVRLVGFGTFSVMTAEKHLAENPQTHANARASIRKRIRFSPGIELVESVERALEQ